MQRKGEEETLLRELYRDNMRHGHPDSDVPATGI